MNALHASLIGAAARESLRRADAALEREDIATARRHLGVALRGLERVAGLRPCPPPSSLAEVIVADAVRSALETRQERRERQDAREANPSRNRATAQRRANQTGVTNDPGRRKGT